MVNHMQALKVASPMQSCKVEEKATGSCKLQVESCKLCKEVDVCFVCMSVGFQEGGRVGCTSGAVVFVDVDVGRVGLQMGGGAGV